MFTTPEAVNAEISYRRELAHDAAVVAQVRRPSRLRRLLTRTLRRTGPGMVTRGRPLSAGI
jgi:hypothetical protein